MTNGWNLEVGKEVESARRKGVFEYKVTKRDCGGRGGGKPTVVRGREC